MRRRIRYFIPLVLAFAFLLTFGLGVVVVGLIYPLPTREEVSIDRENSATHSDWVGAIAKVDSVVSIEYLYTKRTQDWPDAIFKVTNIGSEDLRFGLPAYGIPFECGVESASAAGKSPCGIRVEVLHPGESTRLWGSVSGEDNKFSLALEYFSGNNKTPSRLNLTVNSPGEPRSAK